MHPPHSARSPLPAVRPSACPGLLRIVQALDGGICRIKLPGGLLSAAQADAVAQAAQVHAGGVIEATNRANVQIRGIQGDHAALIAGLMAAGLGPRQAEGDDVRNLMLSPAAGLDPLQLLDVRPLAEQILTSLESQPRLHALSPKFAIQLDGGEALAMLEHHHDLWLSPVLLDGQLWMRFGLAGCPAHDAAAGAVPLTQAHCLVLAVLDGFLAQASSDQHRLRDLLRAGVEAADFVAGLDVPGLVLAGQGTSRLAASDIAASDIAASDSAARDRAVGGRDRASAPAVDTRTSTSTTSTTDPTAPPIGVHAQRDAGRCMVVAGAPLGRLTPQQLRELAEIARQWGDGTLRITPWQGVLLPHIDLANAGAVQQALGACGLLVDPAQPLASLIACTGAAGCTKGQADTKADALRLASLLQTPRAVHLSGCARSCAAAHVAPATLLAVGNDRYDLYLRDATGLGFGVLRATHITVQEAGTLLDVRPRSNTDD